MSAGSESPIQIAHQHRQLQNRLAGADDVIDVSTRCDGPNVDDGQPEFTSEIMLTAEADGVGPVVLEAIADAGLSLVPQPPQGDHVIVYVK
jgi:hypothetical protein